MKKRILLVGVLLMSFSYTLFAKATTDIELGAIFGYGSYSKNANIKGYNVKEGLKTSGLGLNLGCDVEITEKFGLFMDIEFILPSKAELSYVLKGKKYSFNDDDIMKVNFFIDELFGPEYIYYINDTLKVRFGGGIDFAGIVLSSIYEGQVETDLMFGLGTKVDLTYQVSNVVGVNIGCNIAAFFAGTYDVKTYTSLGSYSNSGTLSDFMLFAIKPNISVIFHIGGRH